MNNKADMWLMSHSNYFKPEHMVVIQEEVARLPEDKIGILLSLQLKNPTTIMLVSIFIGELGIDRFMLGDIGMGIGKLLTFGGCLIWWIIDIFCVSGRAKEKNFQELF